MTENIKNSKLKKRILDISYKHKLSHLGSCLTAVDIIKDIYDQMGKDDRFILSQGHAGLALYVVMESLRMGDAERMLEDMGIHPTRHSMVDWGIDCSTGSLGHGLPVALGLALSDKSKSVYCLISDGECMEGSVHEALRLKKDLKADNLHVFLNFNGYGAYSNIDDLPVTADFVKVYQTNVDYLPFLNGLDGHYHVMTEEDYTYALEVLECQKGTKNDRSK